MGTMFLSNEELLKKDDDHKPANIPLIRSRWSAARIPRSKILKRLAMAFALAILVYLFISNLPTDVPIRDRRRPLYYPEPEAGKPRAPGPMPKLKPDGKPQWPKPRLPGSPTRDSADSVDSADSASYNGAVVFQKLLPSLQAIRNTGGTSALNKNVLFAAASLKSASLLLPMACQMGGELKNYVHFALTGGSGIGMDELRAVNGIDESCQVIFHDARPEYATTSSTERLRQSTARALHHINNYMHPQALVIDASGPEGDYFLSGIRKQAPASGIPLIELPENAHSRLAWITKLDSSSLAAWDKISIDILIHATPAGSGSLIRLLKSLSAADFSAGPTPQLTIEVPYDVDRATTKFLKTFQWPPGRSQIPSHPRQLSIRFRVARWRPAADQSSVRFFESFWPSNPKYSHVLVLSPQAQLSTQFFHYLKYTTLHYLYSAAAATQEWDSRLLSISLDLPSLHLDAATPFTPPPPPKGPTTNTPPPPSTPFLWQAPNSNAALYTGQKWTELHALFSQIYYHRHQLPPKSPHHFPPLDIKSVSKHYPSWLEHALQLSRALGYWTLYPSEATARNLAVVHSELRRPPEEYEGEVVGEPLSGGGGGDGDSELPGSVAGGTTTPFESLSGGGGLLGFGEMPLLGWDGKEVTLAGLDEAAAEYTEDFRQNVAQRSCQGPEDREGVEGLFCLVGDDA